VSCDVDCVVAQCLIVVVVGMSIDACTSRHAARRRGTVGRGGQSCSLYNSISATLPVHTVNVRIMVKVSKPSIGRFREQTRFKVVPFHTLLTSFRDAKDGVIDKATFTSKAKAIFETKQEELLDAIYDYLDLDGRSAGCDFSCLFDAPPCSGTIDAGELLCALNICENNVVICANIRFLRSLFW
jgi:hypothetical protein